MKKTGLLVIFIGFAVCSVAGQTLSLSGVSPPTLVFASNTDLWIGGSFTLLYSGTAAITTVTDIYPVSTKNVRTKWNNMATGKSHVLATCEIYKTQATNSHYIVKAWGDEGSVTADNVYVTTFASGPGSVTFQYWVNIRDSKTPKTGLFQLPILVRTRAQAFAGTPTPPVTTLNLLLTMAINQNIVICITGPGGIYDPADSTETIDFGELSTPTPRKFRIFISSSFKYALNISSKNRGVMVHENASISDVVPYTLSIGGLDIPLSSTMSVIANDQPANSDGEPTPYDSVLTPIPEPNLSSGNYSDSLTITISAR
ncbi:MAG: hypothetical protein ABFC85_04335 [Rectinema sp.]